MPPMSDAEFLASIQRQIEKIEAKLETKFAENDKSITEIRIAFGILKADIDAYKKYDERENSSTKEVIKTSSDSNWKWISVVLTLIGLFAGLVYAILKK